MVPIFTCGLLRSNFSLAICFSAPQSRNLKSNLPQSPRGPKLLLATCLLYDLLGKRRRHLGVMRKMHRERRASLRAAAQIRGVTEHLRQWKFHANDVAARAILLALMRRTPRSQIAKTRRHIFLEHQCLKLHDGLEQSRLGLSAGFFESHGARD